MYSQNEPAGGLSKDSENRKHEANKREAFDAMRAYHASEIAHKGHTIEILKTLLQLVIVVYGGLIGLTLTGRIQPRLAFLADILLFIVILFTTFFVNHYTKKKIDEDHRSYEKHREEYKQEYRKLSLHQDLQAEGYQPHWIAETNRSRSGYFYTKKVLNALQAIIITAAIAGGIFVGLIAQNLLKTGQSTVPIARIRHVEIFQWLAKSSLAEKRRGAPNSFLVQKGGLVKLRDGTVVEVIDWLTQEGITEGLLIGEHIVSHKLRTEKEDEVLIFLKKRSIEAPFERE